MSFQLHLTETALEDISHHRKSGNKQLLKKFFFLFEELSEHPFSGTGKPEALKHQLAGCWSRRITQEHRLVYEVKDDNVYVLSVDGHY